MYFLKVLTLIVALSGVTLSGPVGEQDNSGTATQSKKANRAELLKALLTKLKGSRDNEKGQETDKSQPKRHYDPLNDWNTMAGSGTSYWDNSGSYNWGTSSYDPTTGGWYDTAYGALDPAMPYVYSSYWGYSSSYDPYAWGGYGYSSYWGYSSSYDSTYHDPYALGGNDYSSYWGYSSSDHSTYHDPYAWGGYGSYDNMGGPGSADYGSSYWADSGSTNWEYQSYAASDAEKAYWTLEEMVWEVLNTMYSETFGWEDSYAWKRALSQFRRGRSQLQKKELQKKELQKGNTNGDGMQPKPPKATSNRGPNRDKPSGNHIKNAVKTSRITHGNDKMQKRQYGPMTQVLRDELESQFVNFIDKLIHALFNKLDESSGTNTYDPYYSFWKRTIEDIEKKKEGLQALKSKIQRKKQEMENKRQMSKN